VKPPITVIVVTLNAVGAIEKTLKSIAAQTYDNTRVVVVDGGSKDGTLEVIQNYEKSLPVEFISEKDSGIYNAMNKGYGMVGGGLFGYLNAGDVFTSPEALALIARLAGKSDIVSASVDFEAADGVVRRRWVSKPARRLFWTFGWSVPHPGLYINKERLGPEFSPALFDEKFRLAADYDLICRLKKCEFSWSHSKSILVRMSYGGQTTSGLRSRLRNSNELRRVRLHNFGLISAILGVPGNFVFKISQIVKHAPRNQAAVSR
jgi:glycosyltransferase involved in cell wall biosynthesis